MKKEQRETLIYVFLFVVFFLGMLFYWSVSAIVSKFAFHQPAPEWWTIMKYTAGRALDFYDLDILWFEPPAELWTAAQKANGGEMVRGRAFKSFIDSLVPSSFFYRAFPWWLAVVLGGCFVIFRKNKRPTADMPEAKRGDKHIRGRERVSALELLQTIRGEVKDAAAGVATKDGVLIFSGNLLRLHTFVFGGSGQGKSQFLLSFLASFRHYNPSARVICVDKKGEFVAYFFKDGDKIFHPYDARGERWSVFNEIEIRPDMETLPEDVDAISMILFPAPKGGGGDQQFWRSAAASVFCSAVCCCIRSRKTSNQDLINFCSQPLSEIVKAFKQLPPAQAVGLPEVANEKTGVNIIATMMPLIKGLASCKDGNFSVRDWIRNGSGSLFLSNAGKNSATFSSVISLLLDLIGREMTEFDDDGSGGTKYLLLIDELSGYKRIEMLHFFVTEARSKGVAVLLANQSIKKLEEEYGVTEKENLLTNTATKVIFRMTGSKDATEGEKICGSEEVQREVIAENRNASVMLARVDGREGKTKTKQIIKEAVFTDGEIMTLSRGEAIVIHPAAGSEIGKVQFEMFRGEKKNKEFEPIKEETIKARDFIPIVEKEPDAEDDDAGGQGTGRKIQEIESMEPEQIDPEEPEAKKEQGKEKEWDIDF